MPRQRRKRRVEANTVVGVSTRCERLLNTQLLIGIANLCAQRPPEANHVQDGILQPAVFCSKGLRLGVGEDSGQNRTKIAPHAGAIVGESVGDAMNVARAGITGDQRADQSIETNGGTLGWLKMLSSTDSRSCVVV